MVRLAAPGQDITVDELHRATRNRGMPLEALARDITPAGLHYLLAHFDIPFVEEATWRLRVAGSVGRALELGLATLRGLPERTIVVTMECAGNGRSLMEPRPISQPWGLEAVSTGSWTGVPLNEVLAMAKPRDDAVEFVFTGADRGQQGDIEDHYRRSLRRADAERNDVLLAYAMDGRPLEPQHGAPLRLVAPGWYGMAHVKWLTHVEAVTESFRGIQHDEYRYRQSEEDPGQPVERMRVRALMIPPGIPNSVTGERLVASGEVELRGRAWSGEAAIDGVEVGVDGAWQGADLDLASGEPWTWRAWSFRWKATPGSHVLTCRATDVSGKTQPEAPPWNLGGFGNNAVQTVPVTVR